MFCPHRLLIKFPPVADATVFGRRFKSTSRLCDGHGAEEKSPRLGFSLVEVTIALGIVSFSLLAIIGLVGSGLANVRESATDAAIASIIQQVRAELSQPNFSGQVNAPGFNLEFNKSGGLLDNASASPSLEDEPFYRVTFETSTPTIPGGSASIAASASMVTINIASINGGATNRLSVLRSQGQGQ